MNIKAYKTRILMPPKDDLLEAISDSIKTIPEGSILAIASKVVAIWQGRCVKKEGHSKSDLTIQEADMYLPRDFTPGGFVIHTIKNNIFAPSAGVDSSNGDGYYILWPLQPNKAAEEILAWAKEKYQVKKLGIIITDSHSIPLRRGVTGISLGFAGFAPIKDYRGLNDIFERKLIITQANLVDSLASAAVMLMGEGNEITPLALISDIPFVQFNGKNKKSDKKFSSLEVPIDEDLYGPFLKQAPWKKNHENKG
ncbi:MAG: coenzyme F420-0:L-glutamate ligase [Acidobacteriaceae bacterium]